MASFHISYD